MLSVCIAYDHELLRLGIRAALAPIADLELVGEASSGERLIELVADKSPDLVLLDLGVPGLDGLSCVRMIKEHNPKIGVAILSATQHPGDVSAALTAGASAFLTARVPARDLASSLRRIHGGLAQLATAPSAVPMTAAGTPAGHDSLTERERTLLEVLAQGLSTKAISAELWISEKTVKFHLTNIYRKLGVHNRTSALRYAYDNGLVSPALGGHSDAVSA